VMAIDASHLEPLPPIFDCLADGLRKIIGRHVAEASTRYG
jgi:hypothetical protein